MDYSTLLVYSLNNHVAFYVEEYEITITLREIKVLFCCSPLGSIVQYCFGNWPNWYVWAKPTPPPETSWLHVHNNWIWNRCPRLFVFCSKCMYDPSISPVSLLECMTLLIA